MISYKSLGLVNTKDMFVADFYLEELEPQRPKRECIIYDSVGFISKNLFHLSQGRNVMLFENRKLIFSCNMQEYLFMDEDLFKSSMRKDD